MIRGRGHKRERVAVPKRSICIMGRETGDGREPGEPG